MANIRIASLGAHHSKEEFDCGNTALNTFLHYHANTNLKTGRSRTFVITDEEHPSHILGYYTLLFTELPLQDIPTGKLRGFTGKVPVILLGRFAIDKHYQKQGLGHLAMDHIFRSSINAYGVAGGGGIVVDAKDQATANYYSEQFDFKPSPTEPLQLFLPMKTILGSYGMKPTDDFSQR